MWVEIFQNVITIECSNCLISGLIKVLRVHKSDGNLLLFVYKRHYWWFASLLLDNNNDVLIDFQSVFLLYHMHGLT